MQEIDTWTPEARTDTVPGYLLSATVSTRLGSTSRVSFEITPAALPRA